MSLGSKLKKKLTGRMINKGMDEMGNAVKVFREEAGKIPAEVNECEACAHCRERATALQAGIDKYFAVYLKPKQGGFRK